jgi:UDP-glucose 4-epimerase
MNALVTGGLGFIGSNIVDFLIERGWDITVVDNLSTGSDSYRNSKAKYLIKDVYKLTLDEVSDFEYVFHLAALPRIQPSFDEPEEHEQANVMITIHLLQLLKQNKKLKKLVYSASSSCYGNPENYPTTESEPIKPLNPYALQKYASEQYCLILGERFNIPVNTLRYFNAYGPRSFNPNNPQNAYSSVVGIFNNQKRGGKPLTITGNGSQRRDFVHVSDIANANYLAAMSEIKGEYFNIGFGTCYSVLEIAQMFDSPYEFIPERKGEALITHASISKAKELIGWQPRIGILKGIKSYN